MAERRWPLPAAVLGGLAYVVAVQTGGYHPNGERVIDDVLFLVTAVCGAALSIGLGMLARRIDSVVGLVVLTVAWQWGGIDPFPAIITIGFWLVGLVARSHRGLTAALQARAVELESGRERFTHEAVRYERARIARELHDIVAHNLSVIVIQAGAGQRLPAGDPIRTELLDTIVDLAEQARRDLDGLTRILDDSPPSAALSRQSIDELVRRTAATGSRVSVELAEDVDRVPGAVGRVVLRVLQESLTNAIKHAPGAPIAVTLAVAGSVAMTVTNGAVDSAQPGVAVPGSGRGLAGLSERVRAADGTLTSGPTPSGGWQVSACIPC